MRKKLIFKETKNIEEAMYKHDVIETIADYVNDFKNYEIFNSSFRTTKESETINVISIDRLQELMSTDTKMKEYVENAYIYINPEYKRTTGDYYRTIKLPDIIEKYKTGIYVVFNKEPDYICWGSRYTFFFLRKNEIEKLNDGKAFITKEFLFKKNRRCLNLPEEYNFLMQQAREDDDDYQEAVKMLLDSNKRFAVINEKRNRKSFIDLKNNFENLKLSKLFKLVNDTDDYERGLFSTVYRKVVIERI